ncbi:alanine dehydrogenase [Saccharibacillus sp. CPCC 101409]|uniref:alanine dehydrogenase n=1 Tax=Saccharibacillus sp. CPCC 101409 TaxID=3058041 RepID=UPI0026741B33|nr:alanine dehydrogenase [Saccharibacillus sp. CPCC 101409]MDO3409487.1 alanine dehydrogenase [Saccharibacillus sp. CPCC 101409]
MKIGVPKEIKNNENRVGMTPASAAAYIAEGHEVHVQSGAGLGIGFSDEDYTAAGAAIVSSAAEAWAADMVVKIKEPLESEYDFFRDGLILYTYLHLAPEPALTRALLDKGVTGIAYETIQLENGSLPLLTPMSEVAGRMSIQIGAHFLEKPFGGKGVLLGGVPGVEPGRVTIVGGGTVGANAAKMAIGLGADVTLLDINADRLRRLDDQFGGRLKTLMSDKHNLETAVERADLLVGAVLIPGARAPKLVKEDMVRRMGAGSVIVDVAIDQGGSIETIDRITTHDDPVYVKHGVLHYAVANMPGAVARTSTLALTMVTTPYGLHIARKGFRRAALDNPAIAKGINTCEGRVTYRAVAESHGLEYNEIEAILNQKGSE